MPRILLNEAHISFRYQTKEHKKRRAVLQDTVAKFSQPGAQERYAKQAQQNHQEWQYAPKALPKRVRVLTSDWGDVTHNLSKDTGQIYAVLNMANAYAPGGGYLEGMVAQEENMYRRSDCHFYVDDKEMDREKRHYTHEMTALINAVHDTVYLDTQHPRICIKGRELDQAHGYDDLPPEDYFLFYELKSAADDLRNGSAFNEISMRKKIIAQLETLKKQNVRHVVLSAFGCGAFGNPAVEVARIYHEELAKRVGDFDDVVFAIYHAGYGPNNFAPFQEALAGLPLNNEQLTNDENLLSTLKDNVNQNIWNQRGYVFLFFDFRKTPTGILQIRTILNSDLDDFSKIVQLKRIAKERVDNPPKFTKRDDAVHALYENIMNIDQNNIDDTVISQFTAEQTSQVLK